jgi:hypothetical protein
MHLRKIFIADNEGMLDEFLDGIDEFQTKQLIQQLGDELKNYKVVTKNYDKEKYAKFAQPYIDKRKGYLNKLFKSYQNKIRGPK